MSKHRHKDRLRNNENFYYNNRYGPINNNPFGISPNQLLNFLGSNFNMNNLPNILSYMNKDGFDLNSFNNAMNNNFNTSNGTNENFNNYSESNNCASNNISDDSDEEKIKNDENIIEDDNLLLLVSLKNIVDPKKFQFIDKIIDLYKDGKIK